MLSSCSFYQKQQELAGRFLWPSGEARNRKRNHSKYIKTLQKGYKRHPFNYKKDMFMLLILLRLDHLPQFIEKNLPGLTLRCACLKHIEEKHLAQGHHFPLWKIQVASSKDKWKITSCWWWDGLTESKRHVTQQPERCWFIPDFCLMKMMAIASPPLPQMRAASVDIFLAGNIWNSLLQIFKSSYKEVHTLWTHVFSPVLEILTFMCQMLCLPRNVM